MWVIFALLDPDPDSESGSGSTGPLESGSNPNPDLKPCCKLMIFVDTVSLEALRGGSVEVFSAAPAAVRCKLDTRLDTFQQLLQDNQFRNRFF